MSLLEGSKSVDNMKKDSEDNSDDEPEFTYRIYSVLSYFIVLVIIGLPMWWFTTRVYRASLPLDKMLDVEIFNKSDKKFSLPLSLEYDVLITVVNPEPNNLKLELNMLNIDAVLQPFLSTVSPVANFTVKSQWLYLVELGAIPQKKDGHFALYEDQLPHIITPLEKKLWSHLSPRPCINLVIYVTHCSVPVHIYDKADEIVKPNAYLSPGWGGILILNPDSASCNSHRYEPSILSIVSTFVTQLRKLLGVEGASENDLRNFKQYQAEKMIDSTKRTLKSLAELLSEISSIVISDEVAYKVNMAVEAKEQAENFMQGTDVDESLKHAKVAFENSEAAFSDPSLLALLYFPDDQKYAVYIPLFLPVMIPVLMSLTTLRKWYGKFKKSKLKVD